MTNNVEPTPELLAAARRASDREWTFGPEGTVERTTNPVLGEMIGAGLIRPCLVSASVHLVRDDYYRLTPAGEKWLAQHETED